MLVRLIVRRLLFLVFVLFGLSVITFSLSHVVPGDPARLMAGPRASASAVNKIREQFGLNDPLPQQYLTYVGEVLHLNFGMSFTTRRPVAQDLQRFLPATVELGLYAFVISTVIGIPLGVLSAVKRNQWPDHIARFISISGLALPVFWLAIMAQFIFFGRLGWLPDGERLPIGVDPPPTITSLYTIDALLAGNLSLFWLALRHLMMPALVLAYGSLAVVTRMVRGGMLEVLNQDYIRTARAKGITQRGVVLGHALKNALLPTVTSVGLQIGLLLSGAFLVEIVFSWPGIGRYAVDAIQRLDYNATMATTLLIALIFVVLNLLVDILYLFLDPRITYS
ncbi:MAG TPA: ABC transporter permease [Thermomicrobiales bacterium]|nr:ABC transporter permease [Thermomicrobiales bacterium]